MNLVHTLSHSIGVLATESGPNNGPGAWMPELRGILTVIIGVFVLMGSVYFIMMTNMGARLAFLVAFAGLAGWMFLMAAIWWTYGIGLKGAEPSWDPMPGKTVLQDPQALVSSGALDAPVEVADDPVATATNIQDQFVAEGWTQLPSSAPAFGQAASAAETYLIESGAFAGGDYKVVNVFDSPITCLEAYQNGCGGIDFSQCPFDAPVSAISIIGQIPGESVDLQFGAFGLFYGKGNGVQLLLRYAADELTDLRAAGTIA